MQNEDNINPDQPNRVDPSEDVDNLSGAPGRNAEDQSNRVDPSEGEDQ